MLRPEHGGPVRNDSRKVKWQHCPFKNWIALPWSALTIAMMGVYKGELPLQGLTHREVRRVGGSQLSQTCNSTPWTLSSSLEASPWEDPGKKVSCSKQEFHSTFREMLALPNLENQKNRRNTGSSIFLVSKESPASAVCAQSSVIQLPARPGTV